MPVRIYAPGICVKYYIIGLHPESEELPAVLACLPGCLPFGPHRMTDNELVVTSRSRGDSGSSGVASVCLSGLTPAASFAARSAASLPSTPTCPRIYLIMV